MFPRPCQTLFNFGRAVGVGKKEAGLEAIEEPRGCFGRECLHGKGEQNIPFL